MVDFVMPALGADMTSGRLVAWRKQPGEAIRRGEIIAEVETDKATVEVEAFVDGIFEKALIEPGTRVSVGAPLAVIREVGGVGGTAAVAPAPATAPPSAPAPEPAPASEDGRARVSPAARKRARELGVEPGALTGSGPRGRVTLADIEAAAQAPAADAGEAAERKARMRAVIAAAMSRSKREIPHYYLATTLDLQPAADWLRGVNERRPIEARIPLGALQVRAVARALREVPELNGFWIDGRAETKREIHIGVAISLRGGGLVAPALLDCGGKPLDRLALEFTELVTRARAGSLRAAELSSATITLTSLGERGVESVFGVIHPPQIALVGFGAAVERPWVVDGAVAPRAVITASLSADHRVCDGHRGGLFLAALARALREPEGA